MNLLEKVLSFIFEADCEFCGKPCQNYICPQCMSKFKNEKCYIIQIKDNENNLIQHCYLFSYEGVIRQKILQYKLAKYGLL